MDFVYRSCLSLVERPGRPGKGPAMDSLHVFFVYAASYYNTAAGSGRATCRKTANRSVHEVRTANRPPILVAAYRFLYTAWRPTADMLVL